MQSIKRQFLVLFVNRKKKTKKNISKEIVEATLSARASSKQDGGTSVKKTAAELAFEKAQEKRVSIINTTIRFNFN